MDKISIIITCYNTEKYIGKCLISIQNQTYKNFEALIIDDGSSDNSPNVIKDTIKNDNRFIYCRKKNGGVSSARNYGLKKATGKYICFIDGDDYIEDNYLSALYNAVKSDDCDFSICNIKRIYKDKVTLNKITDNVIKECLYPALWNKLCKKSLFDTYGIKFLENVWYEDLAVGAEIFLASKKYKIVNEYIYNYIQHENSLIRKKDDRIFDIYKISDEIEKFAKKNKLYNKMFDTIEFINVYHVLLGTIYRASFHEKFSTNMIKDIYLNVTTKYPNWYKNKYIKNLPFIYKIFFTILKFKMFRIIYIALKLFGKYLYI